MGKNKIIDHIRILFIIPAVLLANYVLISGYTGLFLPYMLEHFGRFFASTFNYWRYATDIIIFALTLAPVFFISPKKIKLLALVVVSSCYLIIYMIANITLFDFQSPDSARTFYFVFNTFVYVFVYLIMASMYERKSLSF